MTLASELHFGRAAERLLIGQPTLSDLIRRLERELGTPLLTRTTRRVALTEAGAELLRRSTPILDDLAAAAGAVQAIASGEVGTVRLGLTPPAAPVLAPHLRASFAGVAPQVEVTASQLWLPSLVRAVADGTVDVALTCGVLEPRGGLVTSVFCSQPLLVGLRPGHRLGDQETVRLADLAGDRLGVSAEALFPAWAIVQQRALAAAGIRPPQVTLAHTDLAATRWADQPDVDWIMLIGSLTADHTDTVIRPVAPPYPVPFTLRWNPSRARSPAVAAFVEHALSAPLPPGWHPGPGHRGRAEPAPGRSG